MRLHSLCAGLELCKSCHRSEPRSRRDSSPSDLSKTGNNGSAYYTYIGISRDSIGYKIEALELKKEFAVWLILPTKTEVF